jgi:hypothetical protein
MTLMIDDSFIIIKCRVKFREEKIKTSYKNKEMEGFIKFIALLNIIPYNMIEIYRRFGGTHSFHYQVREVKEI